MSRKDRKQLLKTTQPIGIRKKGDKITYEVSTPQVSNLFIHIV